MPQSRWCAAALIAVAAFVAPQFEAAATTGSQAVCAGGSCSVSFAYRGSPQLFQVPAGVHTLTATVAGGSGGTAQDLAASGLAAGGPGGLVVARVPVIPGELLTVVVGGRGGDGNHSGGTIPGGYGGGGDGQSMTATFESSGAGGGGSFVFHDAAVLVAAGGGGGAGDGHTYTAGGAGGAGGNGADGQSDGAAGGGAGATSSGPGAGGTGPAAGPATFGVGGASGGGFGIPGAGGGGLYGGGVGGTYGLDNVPSEVGGGGGGSGFLAAGVVVLSRGTSVGNGRIVLSYTPPPTNTRLTIAPMSVVVGGKATLSANVTSSIGAVSGSVAFLRNGVTIGTAVLHSGAASFTVAAGGVPGPISYSARFLGTSQFGSSSSTRSVLTVTAAAVQPGVPAGQATGPTLANTGARGAGELALVGVGLLAIGSGALILARRRGAPS